MTASPLFVIVWTYYDTKLQNQQLIYFINLKINLLLFIFSCGTILTNRGDTRDGVLGPESGRESTCLIYQAKIKRFNAISLLLALVVSVPEEIALNRSILAI